MELDSLTIHDIHIENLTYRNGLIALATLSCETHCTVGSFRVLAKGHTFSRREKYIHGTAASIPKVHAQFFVVYSPTYMG